MTSNFSEVLEFVKEKHAGQKHGDIPVWHHLARVSHRLYFFLNHYGEGTTEMRELLRISALGHDLFEDTDATKEEVTTMFGEEGFVLVEGMTNEWGDGDVAPYVKKICSSKEEIRLIKLSDLNDNLQNVTHKIATLGHDWTQNHFIPIVLPMIEEILKTEFIVYPQTGNILKTMVKANLHILKSELESLKS